MTQQPGPARRPALAMTLVGTLHRLDSHHRTLPDGNRLADVESGNRICHPVSESKVAALLVVRGPLGERAGSGKEGSRNAVESTS